MLKLLAPRWTASVGRCPAVASVLCNASAPHPCRITYATHPNLPPGFKPADMTELGENPDGTAIERQATAYELRLAADKERLKWRTPYNERPGEFYSKLKVFGTNKNEADEGMIAFMQTPIDLSLEARRTKKERKRVADEKFLQQFVADRHRILGNDLAAAHFLVHRGGAVKFTNSPRWHRREHANADNGQPEYNLPAKFDAAYQLEAIRCDHMELYYEGLENIRRLQRLKFLSFHAVQPFDDWCLDRVSGADFPALEVLDVSGTQVTERGLAALYRLPTLRMLIVDDVQTSKAMELTCVMLAELMPELKVVNKEAVH